MPKLYYFRAPRFDIDPESDASPRLGSIFPHLDRLTTPLNQSSEYWIPGSLRNQSEHQDMQETISANRGILLGLNAEAVKGLAGTANIAWTFAKDEQTVYACEKLETLEFEPDEEYIKNAIVASQRVQNYLERALFGRGRVYMITGLKIATGFRMSTSEVTENGPVASVGVDATALGVPVQAGPEVALEVNNTRLFSHGRTSNKIIFAYSFVRIRQKRDGQVDFRHKSGGKYSVDDQEDEWEKDWTVDTLSEEDIAKEVPGLSKVSFV